MSDGQLVAVLLGWIVSLAAAIYAGLRREQTARDTAETRLAQLHADRLADATAMLDRYHGLLERVSGALEDLSDERRP